METLERHIISNVEDCRLIDLQVIPDENGKLAVAEKFSGLPFNPKRMFFLYDVPSGAIRGGHSHFEEQQFIIPVTGAFRVILDDGRERKEFFLVRPDKGLYIPSGIWRELDSFTSGAVCVVLSSINFREEDYVRDYSRFLELTQSKRK